MINNIILIPYII